MANLKVNFGGLLFDNPLIVGAGPTTKDAKTCREAVEHGAAGVVAKTVSGEPAKVPRPNMHDFGGKYFLNTETWSEKSVEEWVDHEYADCKVGNEPLIIGMGYVASDIEKIVPLVDKFADGYEISAHYVGRDLSPMLATLAAAKKHTKKPVFMKISPGVGDLAEIAKVLEEAGADGIVALNSLGPCLSIDIETGMPHMGSANGYGWMSGPAFKPVVLRHVLELAKAVKKIPIFAVGGISTGKDLIEMIMAGATAVQVCTQGIIEGPKAYGRIVKEANDWMDSHGYTCFEEFRGLTIRQLEKRNGKGLMETEIPVLEAKTCIGCSMCEKICPHKAITMTEKLPVFDKNKCTGCGLCTSKCPKACLTMAQLKK